MNSRTLKDYGDPNCFCSWRKKRVLCANTWHMPHCSVSNSSMAVERATVGWVMTAHSCTCILPPCEACHATSKERSLVSKEATIPLLGKTKSNQSAIICTWTGIKTLLCPIFSLDSSGLNFTVKACVTPQGRFFTLSNSTLNPLKSKHNDTSHFRQERYMTSKWPRFFGVRTEPLDGNDN